MADYDMGSWNELKLEISAGTPKTVLLGPHRYEIFNTGNYDNAGSKTANAVDLFMALSSVTLAKTYAGSTADERGSIPIPSGGSKTVRGGRTIQLDPVSGDLTVVIVKGKPI